ncbi:hydantoinase/carbamoylase family amidase [Rhodophyticola sp. CCM32]|uniref:hydantoinase/carbamoylase family amidase n=1 Tax=Rhodophyticola sp. CCM32 TaxID=2916397 RepID=UPI00107F7BE8|nr:hydantoinase/carbamoylase family amidase [Rhodophyticola sp. CCM32]QBY01344.1 hydantoinase/carbamoylase family amidase [Rhodophyticola sp. CCM32]
MNQIPAEPRQNTAVPDIDLAARIFEELRLRTAASRGVTRASYGMGEQLAHDILKREAAKLDLSIQTDAACNLYMTLPGRGRGKPIYIGSHLDSVPLGGNFDGAAGVLLGLSVIAGFCSAGVVPPCDIVLVAIRAEESTWFGASYIGSRAAFGQLAAEELDDVLRAGDRSTLGAAIAAAGGDTASLRQGAAYLDPAAIGMFLEPHIEQGPVLLEQNLPIGIVTGIRGSFRYRHARCFGTYAHSGATGRSSRQDAVVAVSALVVRLNALWKDLDAEGEDMTVTIGQFNTDADEAAFSKVPGKVSFSLDLRSASPDTLARLRREVEARFQAIETEMGVRFEPGAPSGSTPARMHPGIVAGFENAARMLRVPTRIMPCGAGHDAAVFAQMGVPTGMVFIRNRNGSHNPDEHMEISDFAIAAEVVSALCLDPPQLSE